MNPEGAIRECSSPEPFWFVKRGTAYKQYISKYLTVLAINKSIPHKEIINAQFPLGHLFSITMHLTSDKHKNT